MITTEIKLKSSTTNLVGSASCINISSTLKKKKKRKKRETNWIIRGDKYVPHQQQF